MARCRASTGPWPGRRPCGRGLGSGTAPGGEWQPCPRLCARAPGRGMDTTWRSRGDGRRETAWAKEADVIYAFGECELDLDRYQLRRAGAERPVEPQVFDVLA